MTNTKLVRKFDRSVNVADAVVSTVIEATDRWQSLSRTPPLAEFVDVENLNGLFNTESHGSGWHPSVEFQFQTSRVTVLYGSDIRVIIERDR
jgi:hypothetical protein